jgi:hypothetical protein
VESLAAATTPVVVTLRTAIVAAAVRVCLSCGAEQVEQRVGGNRARRVDADTTAP